MVVSEFAPDSTVTAVLSGESGGMDRQSCDMPLSRRVFFKLLAIFKFGLLHDIVSGRLYRTGGVNAFVRTFMGVNAWFPDDCSVKKTVVKRKRLTRPLHA